MKIFYIYIILLSFLLIIIKYLFLQYERSLVFKPVKIPINYKFPKVMNFNITEHFTEHFYHSTQNCILNGLYLHNKNTPNNLLYCHGNAGNISNSLFLFEKLGFYSSIFIFDYRGFGKSTGSPYENGIYDDIFSTWKFMKDILKVDPRTITFYGVSLGCCPASWISSKIPEKFAPHSLILESGFSNLQNLTWDYYPFILYFLSSYEFDNIKNIESINSPIKILLAHSPHDELINIYHKNLILKKCMKKIEYYKLSGSHNADKLNSSYLNKIRSYLYQY